MKQKGIDWQEMKRRTKEQRDRMDSGKTERFQLSMGNAARGKKAKKGGKK